MAATNQTSNYGLPQWLGSDKLEHTDMNTAMADIDDNLNSVQSMLMPVDHLANLTLSSGVSIIPGNSYFIQVGKVIVFSLGLSKATPFTNTQQLLIIPTGIRPRKNVIGTGGMGTSAGAGQNVGFIAQPDGNFAVYLESTTAQNIYISGTYVVS